MHRQQLYANLSKVATVIQASNKLGIIKEPTIVLKRSSSLSSSVNAYGHHSYYKIICYVPEGSILQLDKLLSSCLKELKQMHIDITSVFSEEFYDAELKAYTSFIEVRMPFTI